MGRDVQCDVPNEVKPSLPSYQGEGGYLFLREVAALLFLPLVTLALKGFLKLKNQFFYMVA